MRSTFYTSIVEGAFGLNDQWDLGVEVYYEAVTVHDQKESPTEVFRFQRNGQAHHALTGILPKIRLAPFKDFSALSMESGVLIPTAKDPEARHHDRPFLSNQQFEWWTEVFYVYDLPPDVQVFIEGDFYWRFGDQKPFGSNSAFRTPGSIFFSYFPSERISLYGMTEFTPFWGDDYWSAAYYQAGTGLKYQLSQALELELLYTNFLIGKNQGAGQTFNIGIRMLK